MPTSPRRDTTDGWGLNEAVPPAAAVVDAVSPAVDWNGATVLLTENDSGSEPANGYGNPVEAGALSTSVDAPPAAARS